MSAARSSNEQREVPEGGASLGRRSQGKGATLMARATYRWTAITVVLAALLFLYSYHPYYRGTLFTPFKTIFPPAFLLWLLFGLSYIKATLGKFSEGRYMMRDSGHHLVQLAKVGYANVLSRRQRYTA
ncbi:MAG TPA: hypothetical protein VM580_09395, partial [Labilithrix sp.]|nr:hypothetical protein [Labilithrix sp.]